MSGRRLSHGRLAMLCLASVGGFLVVASAAKIWPMRLVYNASASVPLGWYAVGDASPLRTGEIVVARLPAFDERLLVKRGYLARGVPVLKTIEARAGHRVCRMGNAVTVDGVQVGQARDVDGRSRPLPRWSGCRTLAPDEVFLFNPAAPASFDSRYFGPVSTTRIIGRGYALMDVVKTSIVGAVATLAMLTVVCRPTVGRGQTSVFAIPPDRPQAWMGIGGGNGIQSVSRAARRSPSAADTLPRSRWDNLIDEASRRFGVPAEWVRGVMRVESGGRELLNGEPTTSSAGAIGLMQVMPKTFAELAVRYGLGADPYDPRANILAGTAYLRELYDRFGPDHFLAAYNAGPGRVADYIRTGRSLPEETRRYVRMLAPRLIVDGASNAPENSETVRDLTSLEALRDAAHLSFRRVTTSPSTPQTSPIIATSTWVGPARDQSVTAHEAHGLFVTLTRPDRSPQQHDLAGDD